MLRRADPTPYRPRLRDELVLARDPAGELHEIVDPVVNGRTELGPVSRALVAALDGRPLEEVLEEAARRAPGASREDVERAFRTLLLLGLIEGAGDRTREQARAARSVEGPERTLLMLDGTRVGCRGSGSCCQGYAFGPLTADDLARLSELDLAPVFPHLEGTYTETLTADGATATFLRTAPDGRCALLRDDHRCGLHAAFGPAAKPGFCRLYPLKTLPTVEGIKVYDSGECASYLASVGSGTEAAHDLARLADLISRDATLHHPAVLVAPGAPVDFAHFLRLQEAAGAIAERVDESPWRIARRVAALARAFGRALATCPLGPGEPEATRDAVLARVASSTAVAPDAAAEPAFVRFVAALIATTVPADGKARATEVVRLEDELAATLLRLDAPLLPCDEALTAALRQSIRNTVFGDRILVNARLGAGVLRLALGLLVTLASGSARARRRGATRVTIDDAATGHQAAHRTLRQNAAVKVLAAHDAVAWELAELVLARLPE